MESEKEPSRTEKESWPTRRDVATRLGISISSVRRLEGERLHPVLDRSGVWRFDPREIEQLGKPARVRRRASRSKARNHPGDVASKTFRMFSAGHNLREIVVRTRQPPERIRQLYREWLVGLKDGEQQRRNRAELDRIRRESREDERAHLEWMRAMKP